MCSKTYALCEVIIEVKCAEPRQAARLDELWRQLFCFREIPSPAAPLTLCFDFNASEKRSHRSAWGNKICHSRHLQIYKTELGFYLQCRHNWLDLNVAQSQATGSLDETLWECPIEEVREFFLLSLLMLLQRRHIYGLHANGVIKAERGYLIVGEPAHGKTTLAVSLIGQGWSYLADDALLLSENLGKIEALALRCGFSCTQATLAHFSDFCAAPLESPALPDGKRLVPLERRYPDRFSPRCIPRVLLFPQIAGGQQSQLSVLSETQAMTALLRQSPGIMAERSTVAAQLSLLKQLVSQTRSYQLKLGEDVYHAPARLSERLWAVGEG